MNKEELEKIINDRFPSIESIEREWISILNKFIFETIIPEVLKSIIWKEKSDDSLYWKIYNRDLKWRKQKAKQLYWIDL